jgi:hypothetical protein
MLVDPLCRLVARSLEADWNDKLRALAEAHESYERERKLDSQVLSESRRQQLFSLVKTSSGSLL